MRHSTNQHVQTKISHQLAMYGIAQRPFGCPYLLQQGEGHSVASCPEKFLVIQWKHVDAMLFTGDEDILDVLADGQQ